MARADLPLASAALASAALAPAAQSHGAEAPPPALTVPFGIDDDDTNAATMMMDPSALDVTSAIEDALVRLSSQPVAPAPPPQARSAGLGSSAAMLGNSGAALGSSAAPGSAASQGSSAASPPTSGDSSVDRVLSGNYALVKGAGAAAPAPNPEVERALPAARGAGVEDEGKGLRIALFIGIALLVAVVSGVAVLYARQRGLLSF